MNIAKPQVSIIMATYNRSGFISESLDSIIKQSFKNWECIIVDDGSTDDSAEVIKTYLEMDGRFTYTRRNSQHKKGLPGCRNLGLELAKGQFIIFFDDDDIVHPANLEICVQVLKEDNTYFCRYDKQPFTGNWTGVSFKSVKDIVPCRFRTQDINKMITGKIPFASCCVMWKKECFLTERFNEELMYAEEWECYSRILAENFKGVSISQVLYYNRKHLHSNTAEFRKNNPVRVKSQKSAALLVIERLDAKALFDDQLKLFFVRMGIELKAPEIIRKSLNAARAGKLEKLKYELGYKFYPILKPIFNIKAKIYST